MINSKIQPKIKEINIIVTFNFASYETEAIICHLEFFLNTFLFKIEQC